MKVLNWYVAVALRTLGERGSGWRTSFTPPQLAAWTPEFAQSPGHAQLALDRLRIKGLADRASAEYMVRCGEAAKVRWQLTPAGYALARSVAQAHPQSAPADAGLLVTRLWALLRIRRTLTSDEAANLLLDAGASDRERGQKRLAGYLHGWAQTVPHAVQPSVRRVAGCRRYVLLADLGLRPPPVDGPALPPAPRMQDTPARYLVAASRRATA